MRRAFQEIDAFVLVGFLSLVGLLGTAAYRSANNLDLARYSISHTQEVIHTVEELFSAVQGAESAERGFLLTGNPEYLKTFDASRDEAIRFLDKAVDLALRNAPQRARMDELEPSIRRRLDLLEQVVEQRKTQGFEIALRIVQGGAGLRLMEQIRHRIDDINDEAERQLAQRVDMADAAQRDTMALILGGSVLAGSFLLAASWMVHHTFGERVRAEMESNRAAWRLRASIDSLSQGVAVFDQEYRLILWNDSLGATLPLPAGFLREGLPYARLARFFGPDFLETEEQIAAGSESAAVYERRLPDGTALEIRRMPTPDGGFILTLTDMTSRIEMETKLREAQKMQAVGQLTGGVAHDFNNLLTTMLGNLELIKIKGGVGEDSVLGPRIDAAIRAAERGAGLTRQLLAFARKQPLMPETIDVNRLLDEASDLVQRGLGERIEFRMVKAAGLWPALADPAQVQSAILNLALNARDAMPDGGRLTIETANVVLGETRETEQQDVEPGAYVVIAVSDTGTGMSPEVQAKAFEPFFTTKDVGRGTGLGLSQVFGFAKQSKGHVRIQSEEAHGTTVRLFLPRAPLKEESAPLAGARESANL